MSEESLAGTEETTDAQANTNQEDQVTSGKTYTQEEFDNHMSGLKNAMQKKFEKQLGELGDIEELKQLKAQSEQQKQEEALKKGEFDKIIQDLAAKKDAEIQKRDAIIQEYKVDTPLLNAAAENRSVNPDQVKALLKNQVRLGEDGEVEVVDTNGQIRYSDQGTPLGVTDLVSEFLNANPHFVQPTPSTTNTKSSIATDTETLDISTLDMKNPEHRKRYAEWKNSQQR
jgi:hypothetical protein